MSTACDALIKSGASLLSTACDVLIKSGASLLSQGVMIGERCFVELENNQVVGNKGGLRIKGQSATCLSVSSPPIERGAQKKRRIR